MSLILKGLDMPKYKPLRLEIYADGHVWIDHRTDYECINDVAVQIPHPHGRIKDVDNITAQEVFIDEMSFYAVDCDDIDDAPTILEAEE